MVFVCMGLLTVLFQAFALPDAALRAAAALPSLVANPVASLASLWAACTGVASSGAAIAAGLPSACLVGLQAVGVGFVNMLPRRRVMGWWRKLRGIRFRRR